jgi:membrane fusion protein, multidrug efflux system
LTLFCGASTYALVTMQTSNFILKPSPAQHSIARAAIILVVFCGLDFADAQTTTLPSVGSGLTVSRTLTVQVQSARPAASAAMPLPAPAASALGIDATAVRVLLTPDVETVLLSQMIGRIVKLNGSLGSRVAKGQLVVGMDCSESVARLKMAQAELASARETYDSKVRLKGLDAAGDIEVSLAAAAVSKADGQIEMTKAQIQNCSVYAPFSGRLAKLHVKPHQGVNAGQPLFELVSDGSPRLRLNVPSKWLRTIKAGTPFKVEIDETGKTYKATVTAINSRVDAVAQTIEIEARVAGSNPELLAGMSGTARFMAAQ